MQEGQKNNTGHYVYNITQSNVQQPHYESLVSCFKHNLLQIIYSVV